MKQYMDGNLKKSLGILALLFIIGTITVFAWQKDSKLQKKETSHALKIETPYFSGQGVLYSFVGENAYLITAGHMMLGLHTGSECRVISSGKTITAVLVYLSTNADIAILRAPKEDFEGDAAAAFDISHYDALKEGDRVRFAVCEDETVGTVSNPWIYVEDFSLNMMLVEAETHAGMSGCGVYDEEGFLIGILCGSSEDGTEAAVLPASVIQSEIFKADINSL